MKYVTKLAEGTSFEDYKGMVENHELDDIIPAAAAIVDEFMERFPGVHVDGVKLVIQKTEYSISDIKEIVVDPLETEEGICMPCFQCEAFRDDKQCYANRRTISDECIEGLGCPRIREAVEGQTG